MLSLYQSESSRYIADKKGASEGLCLRKRSMRRASACVHNEVPVKMSEAREKHSLRKSFRSSLRFLPWNDFFKLNANTKDTNGERRPMRRASAFSIIEEKTLKRRTSIDSARRRSSCACKPIKGKLFVPQGSANESMVEKFVKCFKNHDVDGCNALISSKCDWRFSGEMNYTIKNFGDVIQNIVDAFPDFSFNTDAAVEVGPGVVQVKHAVASGTHTGKPFGFQSYNPLPATGVKCVNDPEHLTFFIVNGRIAHVHVICTGELGGPVGLHKQSKHGVSTKTNSMAATAA